MNLIDVSPDGIVIVDKNGVICQVNPALCTLFEYQQEQLIGRQLDVLIPDHLKMDHEGHFHQYAKQPFVRPMGKKQHIQGATKNGRLVDIDVMLTPLEIDGEERLMAFCRDVSSYTKAIADLNKANSQFREMLSIAAHDLRNPLNVISGFIELIAAEEQSAFTAECIEYIRNSSQFMLKIVEEVLDVSQLQHTKMRLRYQEFDFSKALQECMDLNKPAAARKGITLNSEPVGPLLISADSGKLSQVMHNLVSNGIKYSSTGGRVDIRAVVDGEFLQLDVKDDGQGIAPDQHANVFIPFKKTAAKPTAGEASTGLGMSISKAIVEAHGGTIHLASELNTGSTFTVRLPMSGPQKEQE